MSTWTYVVVEATRGWEVRHDYPTTEMLDKFTFPRVMRMWKGKAERIYRVYPNSVCDVLKGNENENN